MNFNASIYKASLDKTAIIITLLVTLLFAVLVFGQYALVSDHGKFNPVYTSVGCLVLYFMMFAFRPVDYALTGEELIVRRPVMSVHISRSDIRSIELLDRKNIRGSLRISGIGGVFGYYGVFVNLSLGRMNWYATRRDRPVLIKTMGGRKIIITPDNAAEFVAEMNGAGK
jgi:hypothetical protein